MSMALTIGTIVIALALGLAVHAAAHKGRA